MSNPLVAQREDSTEAFSGIALAEGVADTKQAIESGDWAAGVMGAVGTGLDALGTAMDPFGSVLAAGVGWLMEHVGPLSDALDELTGDPDQIKAHSETWKNVGEELAAIEADMAEVVKADTGRWLGEAADAYRKRSADTGKLIEAAKKACEGAADGIATAGEVVGAVRSLVRDIIAELVGHLISWALQVLATLGIAMAWVLPQVIAEVAKIAARIADLTTKLVQAMKNLIPLLDKLTKGFGDARKALDRIKSDNGEAPNPDTNVRGTEGPNLPGPEGTHSQSAGPSGNTAPQSAGNDARPNPSPEAGASPAPSQPVPAPRSRGAATRPASAPQRARDTSVPAARRNCKSDPVDIATGEVVLSQVDLELPDGLGALVERTHISSYRAGRWFGTAWASTLDQRVEFGTEQVCYVAPDGVILVYPVPEDGAPVLPVEGPRWPLVRHRDGGCTIEQSAGRTLRFAGGGSALPLREVVDPDGSTTELSYDKTGSPAALSHSSGVRIGFTARDSRLTRLRVLGADPSSDVVVLDYRYDERGRLAEVINSSGLPRCFDYDAAGRLTGWQDRNGVRYRYVYDETGRCVRTIGERGFLDATFAYDRESLVTRYADSLGNTTAFQLNEAGQTVSETDPLGATTHFEWDRYDRLLSRTDPLGRRTRYERAESGALLRLVRPDDSVLELERTGSALTSVAVHDAERTWRRFHAATLFDAVGEPLDIGTEPPAPQRGDRDQFARLRSVPEVGGGHVLLDWTVDGALAARTGAAGQRATWRYDGEGNEVEHVDELGRATRREYGPFDLITAEIDAMGARTEYTYDTELRLVSVTDPLGRTWAYRYDAAGRLAGQTDFDGRGWTYEYDAAGQPTRVVGTDGSVTERSYDVLGNLVEVRTPQERIGYAYDPVGELVRATSGESVVEFEHDEQGRVTRESVDGLALDYAYDDHSSAVRRRTPSGVDSEWTFEESARPVALSAGGHAVRYRLDDRGRTLVRQVDGVSVLQQDFGPGGRLTAQRLNGATGQVWRRDYEHRADGRLASSHDGLTGRVDLDRDVLGRVTGMSTARGHETTAYDLAGNPTTAAPVTADHDAAGRRVRQRRETTSGELVWHYTWTADRLTEARTPDGHRWNYRYDPLGRRTAKERLNSDGSVAESVRFVWEGTDLVEQIHLDGRGTRWTTTWERLPSGAPVVQIERGPAGERFRSIVTDGIGSPVALVDETGEIDWCAVRDLWGRVPSRAGGTPLRFPGQYADEETGLHYNVFRYYDPATARYISQDPLGLEAGPNPTAYVSDPFAEFDLLGLMACNQPKGGKTPPAPSRAKTGRNVLAPKKDGKTRVGKGRGRKPEKWMTRPESFRKATDDALKEQKADPASPGYGGGNDVHARHVISFQTMRDNLKNWVEGNYPPGPQRDAMMKKYDGELVAMNSKLENLPLGPGAPNSAIGSVVEKFEHVQRKIDDGMLPSEAFKESAGYGGNGPEFADPIMKEADRLFLAAKQDPDKMVDLQGYLNDVRLSADFDWSGGESGEFAEWMDMHKQIEAIGSNPQRYSPAEVDGIIDKFHSLDAPSGNHPSQAQWNTRQGN